jgi:Dimethyladenosine transferase (rRNA methylation)
VILLEPLPVEQQLAPQLARTVEMLLKRCFGARRKMVRNTLVGLLPESELAELAEAVGIGLQQRPQEIPPAAWVALAAGLNQIIAEPAAAPTHG